jgi:hypothetical protein
MPRMIKNVTSPYGQHTDADLVLVYYGEPAGKVAAASERTAKDLENSPPSLLPDLLPVPL